MPELHKILYVEDESDIQAVARLSLEAFGGFNVRICSSGKEALELAPNYRPDLILLDVMMPGMDGPTTFQALRQAETTAKTPIIFMTAKVQAHEVQAYKDLGALGVISKPFDPMNLSTEIKAMWSSVTS